MHICGGIVLFSSFKFVHFHSSFSRAVTVRRLFFKHTQHIWQESLSPEGRKPLWFIFLQNLIYLQLWYCDSGRNETFELMLQIQLSYSASLVLLFIFSFLFFCWRWKYLRFWQKENKWEKIESDFSLWKLKSMLLYTMLRVYHYSTSLWQNCCTTIRF